MLAGKRFKLMLSRASSDLEPRTKPAPAMRAPSMPLLVLFSCESTELELGPQSCFGHKPLKNRVVCRQNGTAALKKV